jgi:hypothetical protein
MRPGSRSFLQVMAALTSSQLLAKDRNKIGIVPKLLRRLKTARIDYNTSVLEQYVF